MPEFVSYVLTFSRTVIGIVFLMSFIGKVKNLKEFEHTITNFKLLPTWLTRPVSLLFILGEIFVVVLIIIGEGWLVGDSYSQMDC